MVRRGRARRWPLACEWPEPRPPRGSRVRRGRLASRLPHTMQRVSRRSCRRPGLEPEPANRLNGSSASASGLSSSAAHTHSRRLPWSRSSARIRALASWLGRPLAVWRAARSSASQRSFSWGSGCHQTGVDLRRGLSDAGAPQCPCASEAPQRNGATRRPTLRPLAPSAGRQRPDPDPLDRRRTSTCTPAQNVCHLASSSPARNASGALSHLKRSRTGSGTVR